MKQAFTNTSSGKYGGKPMVAGKAAEKLGRASGRRQQTMPLCNFGAACKRKGCVYRHDKTPPVSNEVCKAYLGYVCEYGRGCFKRHPGKEETEQLRKKYKLTKCMWADNCDTPGCLYYHSWDDETPIAELEKMSMQSKELENAEGMKSLPADSRAAQGGTTTAPGEQNAAAAAAWQAHNLAAAEWAPSAAAPAEMPAPGPEALADDGYFQNGGPGYGYPPNALPGNAYPPYGAPGYGYPPNALPGNVYPPYATLEYGYPPNEYGYPSNSPTAGGWAPQPPAADQEWVPNAAAPEWVPNAAAPAWVPSSDMAETSTPAQAEEGTL